MAFPPLGNSDDVVYFPVDFPANSQKHALFHCIAYGYSHADLDDLCDHLRDIPWEDIFKLDATAATSDFCEWIQFRIDYIALMVSNRSSFTHLHGFQLLLLLPCFIEITVIPTEQIFRIYSKVQTG